LRKIWIFELEKGEKGSDERRNKKMTEENNFFMKEVSERKERKNNTEISNSVKAKKTRLLRKNILIFPYFILSRR
jgi:hypothetical protein